MNVGFSENLKRLENGIGESIQKNLYTYIIDPSTRLIAASSEDAKINQLLTIDQYEFGNNYTDYPSY